ncbi:MAG: CHRD domain-containing protein [Saprospiraceae bacterium]
MKEIYFRLLPILLFASLLAAPLKAQFPHLIFHAELGGAEVIPAVNTDGKALITFLYTPDRTKITVSGMLVRLEGTVTECKIRIGKTGQTGPVLLDLMPIIAGRRIKGDIAAPPALLQNLLPDGVYAEIKTTAHPNGEIRGQFICETDVDYGVSMSGDQMVPASGSTAVAFGGIHFPLGAADVVYAFPMRGLSGPITGVGIYEGQPGENGTWVRHMPIPLGNFMSGLIYLDTMPPDFLRKAREGKYYIVVKTAAFPNGEIRGQINHLGYFCSLAPVNGLQQVPSPGPTPGFGFNHTTHNATLSSLTTRVFINTITPTSVKIHIGNPGQIGPAFVELSPEATPGFYSATYAITEAQLTDFAQGRLYINVTTAAFPNGEIRGVMKNTLRKGYAFDLCGIQTVPPNVSQALGVAVASVDQANCYLNYKTISDGLGGLPNDAYVAEGVFGSNGPAAVDMPTTDPIIANATEIMTIFGPTIENDSTYMEIRTPAFPNGEIRGQIRRGLSCPEFVGVTTLDHISKVRISPVPFQEVLNIELESREGFKGRVVLHDLMGVPALAQPVQVLPGGQTFQILTGNLPVGAYTVSLEMPSRNAAVLLKKVVKVE